MTIDEMKLVLARLRPLEADIRGRIDALEDAIVNAGGVVEDQDPFRETVASAVLTEREACAQVARDAVSRHRGRGLIAELTCKAIESDIRARGVKADKESSIQRFARLFREWQHTREIELPIVLLDAADAVCNDAGYEWKP